MTPERPIEVTVAVNTQRIESLERGQEAVLSSLRRIEDKVDTAASSLRWTPGAKATVIAATITSMGALIAMAIIQGGPA